MIFVLTVERTGSFVRLGLLLMIYACQGRRSETGLAGAGVRSHPGAGHRAARSGAGAAGGRLGGAAQRGRADYRRVGIGRHCQRFARPAALGADMALPRVEEVPLLGDWFPTRIGFPRFSTISTIRAK